MFNNLEYNSAEYETSRNNTLGQILQEETKSQGILMKLWGCTVKMDSITCQPETVLQDGFISDLIRSDPVTTKRKHISLY